MIERLAVSDLDRIMSVNEIGEDILFAGDESDTLFITGVHYDPETVEIIKNFSFMLGDEGEEFLPSSDAGAADQIDLGSLLSFEQEIFDLDQAIDAAARATPEPASEISINLEMPDLAEPVVDLDRIFDAMRINSGPAPEAFLPIDHVSPSTMEMTGLDSAHLPASVLDQMDPSQGIDDIFKKLVLADES
jgi:hypothetical protein